MQFMVRPGYQVDAGDPLALLETMKLEAVVAVPFPGRISELALSPNEQLDAGVSCFAWNRSTAQPPPPGTTAAPISGHFSRGRAISTTPVGGDRTTALDILTQQLRIGDPPASACALKGQCREGPDGFT